MARVYKIEMYIIDVHEDFKDAKDYVSYIDNTVDYGHVSAFNLQTSEKFEWYDEIPINKIGCQKEEFEKFF